MLPKLPTGSLLMAGLPPLMILVKDQWVYNEVMLASCDTQEAAAALNWLYGHWRERVRGFGFDPEPAG